MKFKPSWNNVTYHISETALKKKADAPLEKVKVRNCLGTVGICAAITYYYRIDPLPHFNFEGFNKRESEDSLIDLNLLGIDNVLLIRVDATKNEASLNQNKMVINMPLIYKNKWSI